MFDNYVFTKGTCKNIVVGDKIPGFEMQTLITYYRGIPVSMVYDFGVVVDGIPVPKEMIRISLDNEEWFTLEEAQTLSTYKWEYGEPMYVRVLVDGGLRKGEHDVKLSVSVWPAYFPLPAGGERTRKVSIA